MWKTKLMTVSRSSLTDLTQQQPPYNKRQRSVHFEPLLEVNTGKSWGSWMISARAISA